MKGDHDTSRFVRNTFKAATSLSLLDVVLAVLVILAGVILLTIAQQWLGFPG